MASFRETAEDRANINLISEANGGISDSDVIRVALAQTAKGKRPPAIIPQVPPLADFQKIVDLLKGFMGCWATAVRVGWPDHLPNESEERCQKVDAARKLNEQALAEFGPASDKLRTLLASVRGAQHIDLALLKDAVRVLRPHCEKLRAEAQATETSSTNRTKAANNLAMWTAVLDLLIAAGVAES